jgi:hypothetical protein
MNGWKTTVGAIFLAFTAFLTGAEGLIDPKTLKLLQAICGGLGAFLAAIGIGHKIDKNTAGKLLVVLMLVPILFSVSACTGSNINQGYKALQASEMTYDFVMTATSKAYKNGTLSQREWSDIVKHGRAFKKAWEESQAALAEAATAEGQIADDKYAQYVKKSQDAARIWSLIIRIAQPYLDKYLQEGDHKL